MKTLYLMRHAKSDWAHKGLKDHERPLNERGRVAAPLMGRYFRKQNWQPDAILCSTATRTRQTLGLMTSEAGFTPRPEFLDAIYHADPEDIIALLNDLLDDVESALVIGHNPTMQETALRLCTPSGSPDAYRQMMGKYSTGAVAAIELDSDWQTIRWGRNRLLAYVTPKSLTD